MPPLPQPDDLASLVLRTDFTDDTTWEAVKEEFRRWDCYYSATFVDDPAYSKATVKQLIDANAPIGDEDWLPYLFVADAATMIDVERPLLAVDLSREPGRTFHVPPRWYPDVSANLTIANMDFAEFADAADESGTYRGFEGT
ncbi:hypothetical protein OG992_20590 [Micromonospora sp. NBC_00362]|uniref:DUF6924 domain-containing protein n=1 Tax=Micromonospora sp. NBC_00362 TaxID=2975975 RepID=UPI00225199BD|nr:hypothetical protein [Micromonospora sp. NBC_00362]MCX5119590.1 hypothetical protein [Micromonospora sp. NBC_00362]